MVNTAASTAARTRPNAATGTRSLIRRQYPFQTLTLNLVPAMRAQPGSDCGIPVPAYSHPAFVRHYHRRRNRQRLSSNNFCGGVICCLSNFPELALRRIHQLVIAAAAAAAHHVFGHARRQRNKADIDWSHLRLYVRFKGSKLERATFRTRSSTAASSRRKCRLRHHRPGHRAVHTAPAHGADDFTTLIKVRSRPDLQRRQHRPSAQRPPGVRRPERLLEKANEPIIKLLKSTRWASLWVAATSITATPHWLLPQPAGLPRHRTVVHRDRQKDDRQRWC